MKLQLAPLYLLLAALAVPQTALAQPAGPAAQPQLDDKTKKVCQRAVKKICPVGFPPNRAAIQRCMKANKEKLPPPCLRMIQG